MSEELTQQAVGTETQGTVPVENNPQLETTTPPVEESNGAEVEKVEEVEEPKQPAEPTTEELKAKLREYEVREEEDRILKEKLGIQDVDGQHLGYMNLDQQIVNEGKQAYLRLCNEYSINADPTRINESLEQLKTTDPAKAYEFQRRLEGLIGDVSNKRGAVQQQVAYYECGKFENEYRDLLTASPALTNIVREYIGSAYDTSDIYGQLKNVINVVMPAYQEAFEAGRRYALSDKARKDTSAVEGGTIAGPITNSPTGGGVFTRSQIKNMSSEEFAKYENVIRQQMLEGKIN